MIRHILLRCALLLALIAAPAVALHAQTTATTGTAAPAAGSVDFAAWERDAARAEALVEGGQASTAFLENLRADLVAWRARFLAAQSTNSARIDTIMAQIEALGAEPADGESEPAALAQRRSELAERLAEAQLPRLNATEAFNRANGLISEIDDIVAERQAQALLEIDPTPLNPLNWQVALTSLGELARDLYRDNAANIAREDLRAEARARAGSALLIGVIGLTLLLRGRRWVVKGVESLARGGRKAGRLALGYLVSLGQLVLPTAGVSLVGVALAQTGLASEELSALVLASFGLAAATFYSLWIGGRLFPVDPNRPAFFDAEPDLRRAIRRAIWWIGLFMGLATVAQTVADFNVVPPAARGVLVLPVYLGLGYGFWRLARGLLKLREGLGSDEDGRGVAPRMIVVTARLLFIVAVLGPLLTAVGYINAAGEVMLPMALTLSVLGFLMSLQPVIRDLYALAFHKTEADAGDALLPVLVNFVLIFAALPVLALIWGMRTERLGEIFSRFSEGFSLGDTRITPLTFIAVIAVFAIGYFATRLLQGALKTTVLPRTRMDPGARNAITSGVGYVGIALAAILAVTSAGIDLTALGFVLGALSVGIGFGLQNVVSNFVSGIILLIERPISEGDWIEVNGAMGIVKDISVRSTRIETFDKTDVIVPNADFISGTVTNWTRGNHIGRAVIPVGVAYGTDTRRVQAILQEILEAHPDVAMVPGSGVDFMGFGADSLDFRVRAVLRDVFLLVPTTTELNHQITERFTAEGIEIPYAQRDIWLRNPEALLPRTVGARAAPPQGTPETDAETEADATDAQDVPDQPSPQS